MTNEEEHKLDAGGEEHKLNLGPDGTTISEEASPEQPKPPAPMKKDAEAGELNAEEL